MPLRVLTWNLQGRSRPRVEDVAAEISARSPDVVLLQEVQRQQAGALGEQLGWAVRWTFKHWAVVVAAEGLAILTPTPVPTRNLPLAEDLKVWSHRRRVALVARLDTGIVPITVVNTHLGSQVESAERVRQAQVTMGAAPEPPGIIAGDLNALPGSPTLEAYTDAGWRDAWVECRPDDPGATNWATRDRTAVPTQRLDYVLHTGGLTPISASVPVHDDDGFERYGALSDHLPLLVEFGVG